MMTSGEIFSASRSKSSCSSKTPSGPNREEHAMTQKEFTMKYLSPLVGCTVTKVGTSADEFPIIHVERNIRLRDLSAADRTQSIAAGHTERDIIQTLTYRLEISCDEEGNGPGFVFGLPLPQNRAVEIPVDSGPPQGSDAVDNPK